MGIEKLGRVGPVVGARDVSKRKKTSSSPRGFAPSNQGGSDRVDTLQGEGGVVGVGASAMVESLDALLAAQELTSREQGRDRDVKWGMSLLEDMDALRISVLEGDVGREQLEQISRKLESRDRTHEDKNLDNILDDIELRVGVELAKRGVGEDGE